MVVGLLVDLCFSIAKVDLSRGVGKGMWCGFWDGSEGRGLSLSPWPGPIDTGSLEALEESELVREGVRSE
jgi:hypothetical protein